MMGALHGTFTASVIALAACAIASCLSASDSPSINDIAQDGALPADASRSDVSTSAADGSTVVDAAAPDAFVGDAAAPDAARDATSDAKPDGTTDAAADATPDATPDATTDAATDAASDASVSWPDAGIVGCVVPSGPSGLSPAAEGLPAAGIVLWLRGDRGVYTVAEDAGIDASAPAHVCAWADQSGHGWLLTGGTTSAPEWSSNGVGGEAAIGFPAGNPALGVSSVLGIAPTSPRTFVAVERIDASRGRFNPIMQGQTGSPGEYISIDANTWQTVGDREGVYMTNNSYDTATATSHGTARVHVMTIRSMTIGDPIASALDYRINGQSQTLTLRAGSGLIADFASADFTVVGAAGTSSTGVTPSALIAEVLVYDRALIDTEKTAVETALKARYAIP